MKHLKLTRILAVLVLAACGVNRSPRLVPGTISHYGDPVQIIVPEMVELGEAFEVEITTYGGGCIDQGDTEVELEGLQARIRPYDYDTSVPGFGCTLELIPYTHTASLRFDSRGKAQIQVLGLEKSLDNQRGTMITVTRTLEVR